MRFLRSTLVSDVTPAADGTYSYDLPVNPLSHLILTIKCLNLSADTKATVAQIMGALENITVEYRGQAIISMNGADLYVLNTILYGNEPLQVNVTNLENSTRAISLRVPFGRNTFNPSECMFATNRGELKLKVQVDIADTGYDGVIFQFETVELVEASPAQYLKVTTLTDTPAATGDMDEDLPIGNVLAGILLWATTIPTGTAWTATIDAIRLLVNNSEYGYASALWESLQGDLIHSGATVAYDNHIHTDPAAGDTGIAEQDDGNLSNYALMDYGIKIGNEFLLDTADKSRVHLKITAGDTNPFRVLPLELVKI